MGKEKQTISSSSSQRKRRRIIKRNEKLLIAPPSTPIDVIEEIFLRLSVETLMQLKTLSKQWKSTIESRSFAKRHLKIARRSHVDHPKVMVVTEEHLLIEDEENLPRPDTDIGFHMISLESASPLSFTRINLPQGLDYHVYVSENCDGLFCIHSPKSKSIYVVNPATRWTRQLPPARCQILIDKVNPTAMEWYSDMRLRSVCHLAFVKASDYKLVWLYNSDKYNSDSSSPNEGITKCEVFDFRANAWRYLTSTPSYRIFRDQPPVSAGGSVYWVTEQYNGKIKVVAFDIRTEKFRLLPKINPVIASSDPNHIDMCALDNRLCMSKREHNTKIQDIWRLKQSEDAWEKIFTIDLLSCTSSRTQFSDSFDWRHEDFLEPSTPVAICKNKKILLEHRYARNLVKFDPKTKSLCLVFEHPLCRRYVPYFQSLISRI